MKTTKKPGEVAAVASSAAAAPIDWTQYETTGFDNVSQEDLGIPFLQVLQKGSPEVDKSSPEYKQYGILGAEAGDIMLTTSRTIIHKNGAEPLKVIPCAFEKLFMEWKPRDSGGGLVKSHRDAIILMECRRNERNQDVLKNGNLIVTTNYFYCLLHHNEKWEQVVIGMSSTQQKKARQWLNMMINLRVQLPNGNKITPPMFSHAYLLGTQVESNEKGSWFGWKVEIAQPVTFPDVLSDAQHIAKKVSSGTVRASLPPSSSTEVV